ncbi:uroporphyrinogen decarboxylase family protein [Escherichia coli]|uniref:uroporphyrinogen decarboxylase family protein n=1 Tax=Escherichia coli TaxID=562 RepID=UPI00388D6423
MPRKLLMVYCVKTTIAVPLRCLPKAADSGWKPWRNRLRCAGPRPWTTDIADARRRVGNKVALRGNMDPSMLYAPPARIEESSDYTCRFRSR